MWPTHWLSLIYGPGVSDAAWWWHQKLRYTVYIILCTYNIMPYMPNSKMVDTQKTVGLSACKKDLWGIVALFSFVFCLISLTCLCALGPTVHCFTHVRHLWIWWMLFLQRMLWSIQFNSLLSTYNSERFEPRWVNVVVWVIVRVCSVVLRRTVVGVDWGFNNLSGSHHHVLLRTTLQTRTITQTTTLLSTVFDVCVHSKSLKTF